MKIIKIRIATAAYGKCFLLKYLTVPSLYRTSDSATPLESCIVAGTETQIRTLNVIAARR